MVLPLQFVNSHDSWSRLAFSFVCLFYNQKEMDLQAETKNSSKGCFHLKYDRNDYGIII